MKKSNINKESQKLVSMIMKCFSTTQIIDTEIRNVWCIFRIETVKKLI